MAPSVPNLANATQNKLRPDDRAVHDWYRFVLSFPPHLVREYLDRFEMDEGCRVLDPFCGTGTTIVECKKRGVPSFGVEAHPMSAFAASVKTNWSVDPRGLVRHAETIAGQAVRRLHRSVGLLQLPPEAQGILLKNSISPLPLHKVLVLRGLIAGDSGMPWHDHERLALARVAVACASNLHFGPEVGVRGSKQDAPVVERWLQTVREMADHLTAVSGPGRAAPSVVEVGDSRDVASLVGHRSIDAVICSPPYPNEKDYTRTTRLESVLLGFLASKGDLRALKQGTMLRSNTRGVYKADDDDRWMANFPSVQALADQIEARRIELGKTSGFERLYARVTKLYFGGMARHFSSLRPALRRGARLAYVVGDQASYLRVMIRTGHILGEIAETLGYQVDAIDLFRTRKATATRQDLREEVLCLTWPH